MKRLRGFVMLEVVAVLVVLAGLTLAAVPIGQSVIRRHQETKFIETMREQWESMGMKAYATQKTGTMSVNGKERQVTFSFINRSKRVLPFPASLKYEDGVPAETERAPSGKLKGNRSVNFLSQDGYYWHITLQFEWGRFLFQKVPKH
ncbi:competence protein ComGC [Lacticaseibacillus paracasei]|uniref:competence protein ComGC n=1 Tax=Lacticaseibacillus paracasei TaxID=1597 RepID=UPI0021CE01BA|nr:competence protein ComGC [Lacticaseibacillus paracasei]MCU6430202.1 competence protein ComGC [Lacticaseibacillus paracasei]